MALEDIRRERLEKLSRYEAGGNDAYPATVRRTISIGDLRKKFAALAKSKKRVAVVGRIRALRSHGGATFGDLEDGSGKIQLYWSKDELGGAYEKFLDVLDIGDFVEATGAPFATKRGEQSVRVSAARIVAKSLLPLPEKWHGLKDVEERFRTRELDLVMNEEIRERFRMRSRIIRALRAFLDKEGFLEVETPLLQPIAGGAIARPFVTHHNALDSDLYLRVAPELYLKRLLVGGYERVYELGKSFRNEGIDATHNPEFTSLEWYAAYWDEEQMMDSVEHLMHELLKALDKKGRIVFDGKEIEFETEFPRIEFRELLKRHALIMDYDAETRDSLAQRARQFGIDPGPYESKGKIADEIYKKVCRPKVQNATFITHHPLDISPLAKKAPDQADAVRRFQLIAGGLEIVNAFAELNDPRDQRERFEAQADHRGRGDDEAHPFDAAFVEALEYGMPPAAGAGIGVDRLVMLFADVRNIREVVLFPTLRPRESR
ncbi:lysine--tRNA ligase [Candidatus Parcubacteria bacterium]|nr:MAG: lysine--tRNA ligase [Candidatus Parcubacteria bacterium]